MAVGFKSKFLSVQLDDDAYFAQESSLKFNP